ncbi:hypothetical protein AAH055_08255 [Bacteroides uniformis]
MKIYFSSRNILFFKTPRELTAIPTVEAAGKRKEACLHLNGGNNSNIKGTTKSQRHSG